MEALALLIMGAANIACFMIGARVGQKASKGEEAPQPKVNHLAAYRQKKTEQESQRELSRYDAIMQNVDAYDGTPNGQKDIPGG